MGKMGAEVPEQAPHTPFFTFSQENSGVGQGTWKRGFRGFRKAIIIRSISRKTESNVSHFKKQKI